MKRVLLLFFLIISSSSVFSQIVLTIEGTVVNDTIKGTSNGVSIPRSQPTIFTYRNNAITSVNTNGYMLQAGDETPGINNNNLDGEIITGNKFTWNGTNDSSTTHGLFTGYNLDVVIKYNFLDKVPNGIQRKSDGMTDKSGVIAYNVIKNPKVGIVAKGMNGVKIYNNTFYSEKTSVQTYRGLIDIQANTDGGLNAISTGTKVFNNIFYTLNRTLNIKIYEPECLTGFESDYNVFWCEAGEPVFEINGSTKTFTQWQALGYDLHSVVLNPDFINFTEFVPRLRLNYGINLGATFIKGLAIVAVWNKQNPTTTNQNGSWQVGARIYEASASGIKINIYPNPAHDFFYVSITDSTLTYQKIKIYNADGQIVLTDSIEQGSNIIEIPKHLPSGIYNIALESDELKRYVKKLIVIK